MTPLRILHITHDMAIGGAEQVVRQLVTGVDSARFESEIVCIDGKIGPIGADLSAQGYQVHRLSRGPGFDRALLRSLRGLMRERRIDVVHCHQYTPYSYGVLAASFGPVRVVFTEHGRFHPDRYSWKRRVLNPLLQHMTDEIVAISAATRDALVKYEWFSRRAIRLIYNGVTRPQHARPSVEVGAFISVRAQLGIDDKALVIGTIARLDPIKNQRMMIEAMAGLRKRHPDARMILAGDGPERESLEQLVVQLALQDVVIFTGFITDIAAYLDAMDIFLLTSWSEGTSMTLLEAMSFGKAIIATPSGGTAEILSDRETALFVTPGDVDALEHALGVLALDANARERLGERGRVEFDARFDPGLMVEAYEALYDPS